jgi:TonB family protein
MRLTLIFMCTAVVIVSGPLLQEKLEPPPRYVPPNVVAVTEATYPVRDVVSGTVVLELTIDEVGKVADVRTVRGIASLTEEASRAVLQWKFQPAQFNGRPVPSRIPVAFSFVPPHFGPH